MELNKARGHENGLAIKPCWRGMWGAKSKKISKCESPAHLRWLYIAQIGYGI